MQLKLFSQNYINSIRSEVNIGNISRYLEDQFIFEEHFVRGLVNINFANEDLPIISIKNDDYENSIILFESMPNLTRVQAADPRLWTTLAHIYYWEYMKNRWPINNSKDLLSHYFFNPGDLKSYNRHGLARLWWYVYLTIDENRSDKYELTKVFLKDLDLPLNLIEREYSRNQKILHGLLDHIRLKKQGRRNAREAAKYLNLVGGVNLLDFQNEGELSSILSKEN